MYNYDMEIKQIAENFDDAIESRDIPKILAFFHENCEITILNETLQGKEGALKWQNWLFSKAPNIQFEPIVIIAEDSIFYEEFFVIITLKDGTKIKSRQAETLIFENRFLKSLRIFFDPLDFADIVVRDPFSRLIINYINKKARKGLLN